MQIGATGVVVPPARDMIAAARQQEAAGFASVWWPDHLMAWHPDAIWTPEFTPLAERQPDANVFLDPVACLTAVAVQTERIRIGSSVIDAIRRHPAHIAREFLSIDHFSQGRCILGVGTGVAENTVPYGLPFERTVSRLEQALEIIRALWESDGPVDIDSDFWPHDRAVFGLGPAADGHYPPIWVAAHGPRMLEIAGRLGDGWLPTLMTPERYAASLARILESRLRAGVARRFEPGLWTYVCFGESKDECMELFESPIYRTIALQLPASAFEARGLEPPLGKGSYGFDDFIPSHYTREEILEVLNQVPTEMVGDAILHGSVSEVIEQLRELEEAGCRHACLWNISFLTDLKRLRPSFAAQVEVMRALQVEEMAGRTESPAGVRT